MEICKAWFAGRLGQLSCSSATDQEILLCLSILKCVVMYNYVPPGALVPFITCVCCVVNLPSVAGDAWDTMRKLMGTHLGHSALYQLCQMVQVLSLQSTVDTTPCRAGPAVRGGPGTRARRHLLHRTESVGPGQDPGAEVLSHDGAAGVQHRPGQPPPGRALRGGSPGEHIKRV